MSQTRISITLLLVGVIFAASDQTAELEKSNENGDAQDVYVAVEKPDQPVELEEEDENGEVDHLSCRYKYILCHRLYRYCKRACYFNYPTCMVTAQARSVTAQADRSPHRLISDHTGSISDRTV